MSESPTERIPSKDMVAYAQEHLSQAEIEKMGMTMAVEILGAEVQQDRTYVVQYGPAAFREGEPARLAAWGGDKAEWVFIYEDGVGPKRLSMATPQQKYNQEKWPKSEKAREDRKRESKSISHQLNPFAEKIPDDEPLVWIVIVPEKHTRKARRLKTDY
jgi:hypothetical protein